MEGGREGVSYLPEHLGQTGHPGQVLQVKEAEDVDDEMFREARQVVDVSVR